jgi:hypothetical protein
LNSPDAEGTRLSLWRRLFWESAYGGVLRDEY